MRADAGQKNLPMQARAGSIPSDGITGEGLVEEVFARDQRASCGGAMLVSLS
jgi:hypothetical protein